MKNKYYLQEDCETIEHKIRTGYDYVKDLCQRTSDADSFFVFLFSDDEKINYYTVYYLPVLRREMNISKFVLITPYIAVSEMVREKCKVPYILTECSYENMVDISTYYRSFPSGPNNRNRSFRVIVNGSGNDRKDRLFSLIGFKGIDERAIAAYSYFQFYRIPSDEEVKVAEEYRYDDRKASDLKIDWNRFSCKEVPGPLDFPINIDMGLEPLLGKNINKTDKIVVFSYTRTSRYIVDVLSDYDVVAILDNNTELSGTEYKGVTVNTPAEYLGGDHRDDIKIIVATRSYKAICEQLYIYGYHIGDQVFNAYIDVDNLHPDVFMERFNKGREIYDCIRSRYPDKRLYFISFPGTGDIYLASMYLQEQMRYDKVDDGILVLIGQNCKRVYDVLEFDADLAGIEVLKDHSDSLAFGLFARQIGYEKLNICKLGHGNELLDPGFIRGNGGLDLNEVYQLIAHSNIKHTGIGVRTEDSTPLFETNGLREGHTVIISPYAKCMTQPPEGFWEGLAAALMEEGFDVCTNVAGSEKPIQGTKGIKIPYIQVMDFVNRAGCFIGLRSGLCDIISGVSARKIILYGEDNRSGKDYHYNFCSLEKMGLAKDNLYEMIIDSDHQKTIDEILRIV